MVLKRIFTIIEELWLFRTALLFKLFSYKCGKQNEAGQTIEYLDPSITYSS